MDGKCHGVLARVAVSGVLDFAYLIKGLTAGYVNCCHTSPPGSPQRKIPGCGRRRPLPGDLSVCVLVLPDDVERDRHVDLGVQVHGHGVAAGLLDVGLG